MSSRIKRYDAMKILWLVNIVMPELAAHLGITPGVFGGWLTGAQGALRSTEHELVICTTLGNGAPAGRYPLEGAVYYVVGNGGLAQQQSAFREILAAEKPELVHIFGTEFLQSWALFSVSDPRRTVITLQGLLTFCEPKVCADIPEKDCRDNLLHKLLRLAHKGGQSIELQRRSYRERARYEQLILEKAKHINGLSDWGNAGVRMFNKDCELLPCGSILRDTFYDGSRWEADKCEPHTILCIYSNPIKGFHKLLEALRIVRRYYPDVKVYAIAKNNPYRNFKGLKGMIMDLAPDYEWYVQRLIEKYELKEHLEFPGYLKAEEVKAYLLKANVFVSPSSIENQSTAVGEAMLLGVPTVISCVGDAENMIAHGKEGFVYSFDQTQMLAYYICEIFRDRELSQRLSAGAVKKASVMFGKEENTAMLLEMYDRMGNHEPETVL